MIDLQCISLPKTAPMPIPEHTVLCLGNFDGVHLAHKALIRAALALRDKDFPEAACGVLCFREPSQMFLQSDPPARLCTPEQQWAAFFAAGAEFVILADFPTIMHLSPEAFVADVLIKKAHASAAVCGFNYRFGKGGVGTPQQLKALLNGHAHIQKEILSDGISVSSTRIRSLLYEGDARGAARLLGRPYTVTSPVVHGKALGKRLGSPTLNQYFPKNLLIPRHGVYVTECGVGDRCFRGVTNVGIRPTVESQAVPNCETYLLDFSGDLYDAKVSVSFLQFLRPERQFPSQEALSAQIQEDIAAARAYHEPEVEQ